MELEELLSKKRGGDIAVVAEIIGESAVYTSLLLKRPKAKKHQKALKALERIIMDREKAIEEAREQDDQEGSTSN